MSNLVPFKMLSAVAVLDSSLEGWSLLDIPATALVHVGLVGLDVSKEDNLRVRLRALDVSAEGFTLHAETWFNTRIWSVEVSWLAIGV
jgi:hypothetical protein